MIRKAEECENLPTSALENDEDGFGNRFLLDPGMEMEEVDIVEGGVQLDIEKRSGKMNCTINRYHVAMIVRRSNLRKYGNFRKLALAIMVKIHGYTKYYSIYNNNIEHA